MRPLTEIMKELELAANDIQEKHKEKERLDKAQSEAAIAVEEAKQKAYGLRKEMEDYLNLLVPSSTQDNGRVRQTL